METYASIDDVPLPALERDDVVAIKLHMGERGNRAHVRPGDVALLVRRIKQTGARVFLADTTTLYHRKRYTVEDYLKTARLNGFDEELIGCPIVIADEHGGKRVDGIDVAKGLLEANCLIVFSHATGHITTGFAAAVKNVAMGCVTKRGKRYIHSAAWPRYREDLCERCGDCTGICPFGFLVLKERIELNLKDCPACERCLNACPTGALYRPNGAMEECYRRYAESFKAVVSCFEKVFYINELNRVTRFCDCSTDPGEILCDGLGFVASEDAAELDLKSVEIISQEKPEARGVFGEKWENFSKHVLGRIMERND